MDYLKLIFLIFLNKTVKLNYKNALIYYSIFSYLCIKKIIFDKEKLNGSRKYVSLLCGNNDAIENVRKDKWNYKYLEIKEYPFFIMKNIGISLYYQRKTLFIYLITTILKKLYMKKKISILDYKNTLKMLIGFPLLFWLMVLPLENYKKITRMDINILCTISAIISFLNEDKKRSNILSHFMLVSII